MEVTARNITLPHERLRMMGAVLLLVVMGLWMQFHFANLKATNAPTSTANLAGAAVTAQPLVDALEKYHADNRVYPIALTNLSGAYLPTAKPYRRFLYSAKLGQKVLKSDQCKERSKGLDGWIMKEQNAYREGMEQFEQDCVSGYRQYTLQSADFPPDPQARSMERWAAYDSETKQWTLGWCSHSTSSQGRPGEFAENGICRWREGKIPVDYSQVNQPPTPPR